MVAVPSFYVVPSFVFFSLDFIKTDDSFTARMTKDLFNAYLHATLCNLWRSLRAALSFGALKYIKSKSKSPSPMGSRSTD